MTHETTFWIWPLDAAAQQTRARTLTVMAAAFYLAGALVLLAQTRIALPHTVSNAASLTGVALVMLGIAASFTVAGKVLLTRSRLSAR